MNETPCVKCGRPHVAYDGYVPGCAGHVDEGDGAIRPCLNRPINGGSVCGTHGGRAPQVKAKAEARVNEAKARAAVERLNLRREIHPNDALLEEVYRAAGAVAWLDQMVQSLESDDMVWGRTEEVEKGSGEYPGTDTTSAAELNVWVRFWQGERDRLVRVSKAALDANIDERRVRLAEQQGALVADVVKRIFGGVLAVLVEAGLEERFVQVFHGALREVAPRELRALASGGGEDG